MASKEATADDFFRVASETGTMYTSHATFEEMVERVKQGRPLVQFLGISLVCNDAVPRNQLWTVDRVGRYYVIEFELKENPS